MQEDIYEKLADFLNELPAGFPRSNSGVELRILRKLFTPEEAGLALHLTLIPEEPRVVAYRAKVPVEQAAALLESMEKKQLILCDREEGKPPKYMAEQFVVGFWEGQVNRLDRELVEAFEEYNEYLFQPKVWGKVPQLRTIPVNQAIPVELPVMPYESIATLFEGYQKFAVVNCICRQEQRVLGHDDGKPLETCLGFDGTADFFVKTGRGRWITREEARDILLEGERAGLVLQPTNIQSPTGFCLCCGCCCGVLRNLKRQERPADMVASAFHAVLDEELCASCGTCLDRCQMDALTMGDTSANLNLDRCIGCGLCVTTCTTGALTLARKPASQQPSIPKDFIQMHIQVAQTRGRLGPAEIAGIFAKSKIDRLRAK